MVRHTAAWSACDGYWLAVCRSELSETPYVNRPIFVALIKLRGTGLSMSSIGWSFFDFAPIPLLQSSASHDLPLVWFAQACAAPWQKTGRLVCSPTSVRVCCFEWTGLELVLRVCPPTLPQRSSLHSLILRANNLDALRLTFLILQRTSFCASIFLPFAILPTIPIPFFSVSRSLIRSSSRYPTSHLDFNPTDRIESSTEQPADDVNWLGIYLL